MSKKPIKKLTKKQEDFCVKYVETGDITESYRCAYDARNMSPAAVSSSASRMLRNASIAKRIEQLRTRTADKLLVSKDSITREFAKIGFSDVRKFFGETGELLPINKLSDEIAGAVSSFKVTTKPDGKGKVLLVNEIKLWPKLSALENLSDRLALFEKNRDADSGAKAIADFVKEMQVVDGDK